MTISNSTVRVSYAGNDSTTNFAFSFEIEVNTYLEVYLTDSAGVETLQTLGVHYTVNDVGNPAGGDIDMTTPPATGETLTLVKAQPISQNTAISTLATFRTAAFEEALDWIMKGLYRVLDMASRSPQLRNADADGSGKYDFNGNQASNLGTPTDTGDIATVGWSETRYTAYLADVDQQVIDAEAAQAAAEAAAVATAADAVSTAADAASTAADVVSADAAEAAAIAAQAGAEAALASTLTAYDNFDDRYLGAKASDPALDNDGDALVAGQLYFNTTSEGMFVYTGSAWVAAYVSGGSFLPLVGGTMTGNLTLAGDPTSDLHAATKQYVDAFAPTLGNLPFGNPGEQYTTNEAGTAIELSLASKYLLVRKGSAGTIAKGTPVYVTGYNPSGFIEVEIADSSNAAKMPATGLAFEELSNTTTARVLMSGQLNNIDTSSYSVGDGLYVADAVGADIPWLTTTKPVGSKGIQRVATVMRSSGPNGAILIQGAGRRNDIPNFSAADKFWYGGTGGVATEGSIDAAGRALLTPASAQPTFKAVTETRFAVTGTTPAIDPANGGIQTWTLSGNSTPTEAVGDGESVTLHVADGAGAYTVSWASTVTHWVGGSAPTLPTSGFAVIEIWRVNTVVYAAYLGDVAG